MSAQCTKMSASPQTGHERRTTQRALKAWTEARVDDELPDLAGLTGGPDMTEDREVFTANQFLIMIEAHTSNTVVIFYGSELPNRLVRRNLGHSLRQTLPLALREIFRDACGEVLEHGETVYRHGKISTLPGDGVLYRSIFMPLRTGSHSEHIYIFGAFSNELGGTERLAAA